MLLWQLRNETIRPFGETAQQVFARISALRDSLDGPSFIDQGIVNTDPRTIAVPDTSALPGRLLWRPCPGSAGNACVRPACST